ncbi:MAG: hypothetical protein E7665_02385 [Ruminococcaceae bacterium]|nr:hypothetical protein [Oscillospiraceae bacterium]
MLKKLPRPVISIASFVLFSVFYVVILAVDRFTGGIQSFYIFASSPLLMVIYCALCGYFLYRPTEKVYKVTLYILLGYAVFFAGAAIYNAAAYESYDDNGYFIIIHLFYIIEITSITPFCSRLSKRIGKEKVAKEKAGFKNNKKN